MASDDLLPTRPGARSVDVRYLASTGDPLSGAPFIQSEIVNGPCLRLELSLVARREQERLEALCGEEEPLGAPGLTRTSISDEPPDPAAMDRVLDCLAGLWGVSLDGVPAEVEWDFRSAPALGVTGLVTCLPTGGLEPDAHLLEIAEVFVETGAPDGGDQGESGGEGGDDGGGEEPDEEEEPELRRHLIRFRR